jgi:hypothetical protein
MSCGGRGGSLRARGGASTSLNGVDGTDPDAVAGAPEVQRRRIEALVPAPVGVEEQHVVEDLGTAAGAGAAVSPIGTHPGEIAAGHPDELHGGRGYVSPPTAASTVITGSEGVPGWGSPYRDPGVIACRCRAYSVVVRSLPEQSSPQQGTTRNPEEHPMPDFKSNHNSNHHNDNHHDNEHHDSHDWDKNSHEDKRWDDDHDWNNHDWNDKHSNDWDDKSWDDKDWDDKGHEHHEDHSSHDYSHQPVHH